MNQTNTEIQFLEEQKKSVESLARQFSNLDDLFRRAFDGFQDRPADDGFLDLRMFRTALSDESRNRRTSDGLAGVAVRFPHLTEPDMAFENKLSTLQSWLLGMSHLEGSDLQGHEAFSTWSHVQNSFSQYHDVHQRFLKAAYLAVNGSERGVSTNDNQRSANND